MRKPSAMCRGEEHSSCGLHMRMLSGKKFRCSCSCHPTAEEVAARERRARERDEERERE